MSNMTDSTHMAAQATRPPQRATTDQSIGSMCTAHIDIDLYAWIAAIGWRRFCCPAAVVGLPPPFTVKLHNVPSSIQRYIDVSYAAASMWMLLASM